MVLAVGGCAHNEKHMAQPASEIRSPYAHYLPQIPPSETNRIEHSSGFSIVSPVGWKTRMIPVEDFLKDYVADEIVIEGKESDEYKPRITIQRLGPAANRTNREWLEPGRSLADGWVFTQFQSQPALAKFLPGYGRRQAVRGTYHPDLQQEVCFEREGKGFRLTFYMRNADGNRPYYTQPLPIIQQYFETFRYKPQRK